MNSKEALENMKIMLKSFVENKEHLRIQMNDNYDTILKDLEVLDILKGLFISKNGYDIPYYSFTNRICVDTSMTATQEEINKVINKVIEWKENTAFIKDKSML